MFVFYFAFYFFCYLQTQDDGYSFQSVAVRAKSKGTVRLASSNSYVKPVVDTAYLSDPAVLVTLREGIKLGRELANSADWGEFKGEEVFPGPNVQTDDEIDEYIRNTLHTANALTGTCKMGTGADAVVCPDLRVRGVNGVRVCDSSVLPSIPGGQTGTPTVMVAERAADFIKNPLSAPTLAVVQNVVHHVEESDSTPAATVA